MGDIERESTEADKSAQMRWLNTLVAVGLTLLFLGALLDFALSFSRLIGEIRPFWDSWPSAIPFFATYASIAVLAVAVTLRITATPDTRQRVRLILMLVLGGIAIVGSRSVAPTHLTSWVVFASAGALALPFATKSRVTRNWWVTIVVALAVLGALAASISDGWGGVIGLPVILAVIKLDTIALIAGLAHGARPIRPRLALLVFPFAVLFGMTTAFAPLLSAPVKTAVERVSSPETFSAIVWNESDGHRQNLARDLLSRGLLNGKTRDQVFDLIGKPEESWTFEGYFGSGGEEDGREYFELDAAAPLPDTCDTYPLNYPGESGAVELERLVIGYDGKGVVTCAIVTAF